MEKKFSSVITFLENIDFKSKVMETLPGFVFLYEIKDNDLVLIKWNSFHNKLPGYTEEGRLLFTHRKRGI